MHKLLILAATTLALAGCNPNPNVATPNQAVTAVNAYNALQATGRAYLASPSCTTKPAAALCQQVFTSLALAYPAAKQVLAALKANQAAPITAVQALSAAYSVIESIPQH